MPKVPVHTLPKEAKARFEIMLAEADALAIYFLRLLRDPKEKDKLRQRAIYQDVCAYIKARSTYDQDESVGDNWADLIKDQKDIEPDEEDGEFQVDTSK